MIIKWNKSAVQQLLDAIEYIEAAGFASYAEELERDILNRIKIIPENPEIYPTDKYRKNNDGTYRAFEVDNYRISYRNAVKEIRIVRIRHTSRKTRKY